MLDQADVLLREYGGWVIGGMFLLILWVFSRQRKYKNLPSMRDITMTVEGRRLHVQRVTLERICDGLLEAVINGEITDDEANIEMAKLAKIYSHPELIPLIRKKKPAMMKAQLKNNKRMRALNGGHYDKVQIPDPKDVKTTVDEDSLAAILGS
jgi:hypothetical protein